MIALSPCYKILIQTLRQRDDTEGEFGLRDRVAGLYVGTCECARLSTCECAAVRVLCGQRKQALIGTHVYRTTGKWKGWGRQGGEAKDGVDRKFVCKYACLFSHALVLVCVHAKDFISGTERVLSHDDQVRQSQSRRKSFENRQSDTCKDQRRMTGSRGE